MSGPADEHLTSNANHTPSCYFGINFRVLAEHCESLEHSARVHGFRGQTTQMFLIKQANIPGAGVHTSLFQSMRGTFEGKYREEQMTRLDQKEGLKGVS